MVSLSDLTDHLDALLRPEAFSDLCPNGLQVPGHPEVRHLVTGVSAQRELFERAVELDAQAVLVHHGLFWEFQPTGLSPRTLDRLGFLLANQVSLLAYHLPLDAHPEVGNNALIAAALGCATHEPFGEFRGVAVGRLGRYAAPVALDDVLARLRDACGGREPLHQGAGPATISSVAIVSGSAADCLDEAVARGCDMLITGEPREHVMADAREAGIHFVAAGHYATETHGVRALGDLIAARFGVEHVFVDVPNPV